MAKIVYFLSPFDETKRKEFETDKSVAEILENLDIRKESLCVTLNGITPEDFDLEYIPSENDVIEIRKIVNGEGSSSGKQNLALLVQIAAIVLVNSIPGLGQAATIAILVGGSLISGALMKRAAELALGDFSNTDDSEIDISANNFSLTNASNEVRALAPMPLVLGEHRMAPDIHADAYRSVYAEQNIVGEIPPLLDTFYPGITAGNGVDSVGSNWATMPANYVAAGLPRYNIRIAPYHFLQSGEVLTGALNTIIINKVKNNWLNYGNPSFLQWNELGVSQSKYAPLVIYHPDAGDPFYGKYDLWFLMARVFEKWGNNATEYFNRHNGLFTGVYTDTQDKFIFSSIGQDSGPTSKNLIKVTSTIQYWYPSTVVNLEDIQFTLIPKYGTFLSGLNNGVMNASNKASSFPIELQYKLASVSSVAKEGIDYSTQVFNYGIGDLTISKRKIGLYDVDAQDYTLASTSSIITSDAIPSYKWLIPAVNPFTVPIFLEYFTSVLSIDRKHLSNTNSPSNFISVMDQTQYNWIQFEGKLGQNSCRMNVSGNIYSTSGGGISANSCVIECHWKSDTDTIWQYSSTFGIYGLQNDNTKKINFFVQTDAVLGINKRLQIRVRKVTLDSANNENGKICSLYVDNIRFVKTFGYYQTVNPTERLINAPMNLEGLGITALVTDVAQTNKFSALVKSKCWVYNFTLNTWSWTYTSNPAFWFLYFARGGFLNLASVGAYTTPYSPTIGWQNYAGHPNNTEIIFGAGLKDDRIDMVKILEWAQFCQTQQLYFNMVLTDDTSCADVLERIANAGRGSVTYYNGLLSVVYEDPAQVPTCLFGMGNIKAGSFSVNYQVGDPVGRVVAKYTNKITWESEEVGSPVPFTVSDNYLKVVEVTLGGVTSVAQAQREVNILAARQFFQRRTYSWDVDIEGLLAKRGDVVYLSHDSTQYGFSGRVKGFIIIGGVVTGIETTSVLDESINYITIREPNGDMNIYEAHTEGNNIIFDEAYPISKASFYISNALDNNLSNYYKSIPEDFVFISGAKETPGKLVRISEIRSKDDFNFTFIAYDEDPAMWSYEYEGVPINPESFDNVELDLSIVNVEWKALGNGLVKINWENVNGDFVTIVNDFTGLPIQANGSYSFSGGEVILELMANQKYDLTITPFTVGTQFKTQTQKVTVWPT